MALHFKTTSSFFFEVAEYRAGLCKADCLVVKSEVFREEERKRCVGNSEHVERGERCVYNVG